MQNKSDLTIVSALFDIGRGQLNSGFSRSFDHYLESFKKLLKIKYNLVLFLPPELNDFVWQYRSPENTRIVNKTIDDLRKFPFYNKVQKIRNKPEWYNQSGWMPDCTQAKLELYNPLVMSKFFFVNDASLFNFFNTKYFLWFDAGLANTIGDVDYYLDDNFEDKIIPHLEKCMFVAFPYDSTTTEVHGFTREGMTRYAGKVTEYVCRGGMFGGSKEYINEINAIYYDILQNSLNEGLMGTEESIFSIISYRHPDKCKVNMIESNGLIATFLNEIKRQPVPEKKKAAKMAWYFLVFNTPQQFEITIKTWKDNYPEDFNEAKKYVVNNSNDPNVDEHYKRLFKEYDLEEFKFDNIGITSGRQWVAEHFDKTDHEYYVFVEEDMKIFAKNETNQLCQSGFQRYHDNLFKKSIEILNNEGLDFLRLTFSEFYGTCMTSWSYINNPKSHKDLYYPPKDGLVEGKDYSPNLLNKPKVNNLGIHKNLPYAIGNYHYSNWPCLMGKKGNKLVFLDTSWRYICEQVLMSHVGMLWEDGKIKIGTLLASPIIHDRVYHYDGKKRRENNTYTN